MKKIKQKVYKCKMNKNLIFTGVQTMNAGEIQIFVNKKFLMYADLDNFGYDYESPFENKFKEICDIICYDLFTGDEMFNIIEYADEGALREIKENY